MIAYDSSMNDDVVRQVRRANEAAITLITLLVTDMDQDATNIVSTEDVYRERTTCMALGVVAASAMKVVAEMLGCEYTDVTEVAALSIEEYMMHLENRKE